MQSLSLHSAMNCLTFGAQQENTLKFQMEICCYRHSTRHSVVAKCSHDTTKIEQQPRIAGDHGSVNVMRNGNKSRSSKFGLRLEGNSFVPSPNKTRQRLGAQSYSLDRKNEKGKLSMQNKMKPSTDKEIKHAKSHVSGGIKLEDLVSDALHSDSEEEKAVNDKTNKPGNFGGHGVRRRSFRNDLQHGGKDKKWYRNSEQTKKEKTYDISLGGELKSGSAADFFSSKSFKDIGSSEDMIHALNKQQIIRPSYIQAMAYDHVLKGESCIIAEQSGSGKTLAYLAPLIQRLREEELQQKSKSLPKQPRVLVLVPTAELAAQVLYACRVISRGGMPFRSLAATGGFSQRTQSESLEQSTDLLIATPGRFNQLLEEERLSLNNLLCIVLDEVDILLSDDKFFSTMEVLMSAAPWATQYIFVTATLPLDIHSKIVEKFPDCKTVLGPGLHRTCSGLEEILVDCSGEQEEKTPETAFLNKKTALMNLVTQKPVGKTIIFCNKIENCRKVENVLTRHDRKGCKICVFPFHAAITQEERVSNLENFLKMQSDKSSFLVCTDRASRGLDINNVDHVVLFDFPRDPSEYVRRVGRTARAGGVGKAYVFVVGKQVPLANKIITRNEKGHPLHELPAA